jgi:cytochrome c biogenesis protein CcmG/thiol:disulfide interchange protein DsbE
VSPANKTKRGRTSPRATPGRSGPPVFLFVLIGIVAIAAIVTVLAVVTGKDDSTDTASGSPAPTLEGTDLAGEPLTIPAEGPKVVVFLAHWCPHCQAEVPLLVDWIDSGEVPDGVEVYGVATNNDPAADNYPADEWLAREGWEQPTLLDDEANTFATDYGVQGFPYIAFVDADGTIVSTTSGEQPISEIQSRAEALVS